MLQAVSTMPKTPQCLIPVPLHPARLKQRGYNQTVVLTKLLAKKLYLPYDLKSCQKTKNTPAQASLEKTKRYSNLHQAFKVRTLPYSHVVLVDDLLTTGSTANELALALKKTGIARVDIWCCARTVYE